MYRMDGSATNSNSIPPAMTTLSRIRQKVGDADVASYDNDEWKCALARAKKTFHRTTLTHEMCMCACCWLTMCVHARNQFLRLVIRRRRRRSTQRICGIWFSALCICAAPTECCENIINGNAGLNAFANGFGLRLMVHHCAHLHCLVSTQSQQSNVHYKHSWIFLFRKNIWFQWRKPPSTHKTVHSTNHFAIETCTHAHKHAHELQSKCNVRDIRRRRRCCGPR